MSSKAPWPRGLILAFGELARRDEGSNPGEGTFLLETIGKKKARLRRLQKRSTKRSEAEKRRSDRDEKKSGPEPAVLITSHQSVGPVT